MKIVKTISATCTYNIMVEFKCILASEYCVKPASCAVNWTLTSFPGSTQPFNAEHLWLVSSPDHTHQRRERSGAPSSNLWTKWETANQIAKWLHHWMGTRLNLGASLRMRLVNSTRFTVNCWTDAYWITTSGENESCYYLKTERSWVMQHNTGMCSVTIIIFIESCDVGSFSPVQGFELSAPDPFPPWWVWSGDETILRVC